MSTDSGSSSNRQYQGHSAGRQLSYDFSSRKFLIFVYVATSSSWLLWIKVLPPDEYVQLILWVTVLYFGANLWQSGVGRPTSTPFKLRLFSRKFLLLLGLLLFFTLATISQVMPAAQYTTLIIWMTGIYFGIDIGELHAFRGLKGVGKMFRDDVDPGSFPGPFNPHSGSLPPYSTDSHTGSNVDPGQDASFNDRVTVPSSTQAYSELPSVTVADLRR